MTGEVDPSARSPTGTDLVDPLVGEPRDRLVPARPDPDPDAEMASPDSPEVSGTSSRPRQFEKRP
jgi:hypothetical protein